MVDLYTALTLLLPLALAISVPLIVVITGRLRARHARRAAQSFPAPVSSGTVSAANRASATARVAHEVLQRDVA